MMHKFTGLENRKILIVEDVELNQYLVRHIMESWGCIVKVADNGQQAIEKINDDNYDLILMDIQMPVMDGIEATKIIRGLNSTIKSSIPIVALTANAMPNEFAHYIKAGMNDCLQKPFEEPTLFNVVSKHIKSATGEAKTVSGDTQRTSSAKMYDLNMVEMVSGGDHSFILKMLRLFLETVPDTLRDLHSSAEKHNWLEVSKLAHKLKSTIDSMGITELKQDIRVIETNARNGAHPEKLPGLVNGVIKAMERVMIQVRKDHSL
jgi:CheY-like chemotaxis protein